MKKTSRDIVLLLKDYPLEYANSLRRIALSEVPVMAIDHVYFIENTTVLYDEIIAHRLGLIPLTSEEALEKYRSPEECAECTDCKDCYARLYIDVEAKDGYVTVYSKDLKSEDPDVKPVVDNIPIVILAPGQKLVLEAYARLGRGKEHAKWNAASVAVVKYAVNLYFDLSQATNKERCIECVSKFSEDLGEAISEKGKGRAEIIDEGNTSLLVYCSKRACGGEALKVDYDSSKLVFKVETTGSLRPERIILEATKVLESKLQEFLEKLDKEVSK